MFITTICRDIWDRYIGNVNIKKWLGKRKTTWICYLSCLRRLWSICIDDVMPVQKAILTMNHKKGISLLLFDLYHLGYGWVVSHSETVMLSFASIFMSYFVSWVGDFHWWCVSWGGYYIHWFLIPTAFGYCGPARAGLIYDIRSEKSHAFLQDRYMSVTTEVF